MVTTTKNAVKECVVIVLYQLRNGGPLGLIEAGYGCVVGPGLGVAGTTASRCCGL